MGTQVILKEKIKSEMLKILSGFCFRERDKLSPKVSILSPWISDVQLEIDKDIVALDPYYFNTIYCIASVNFAHDLFLLRTALGAEINIVTLPPTEEFYRNRSEYMTEFLDFLDEIGCNIFINANLHAKLFLSNDNALVGSFNLSKAALYDREEIGISVDDLQNLKVLEIYFQEIVNISQPYGYTAKLTKLANTKFPAKEINESATYLKDLERARAMKHVSPHHGDLEVGFIGEKVTRGWLYEDILRLWYRFSVDQNRQNMAYEFLSERMNTSPYYDGILREASSNINNFYFRAFSVMLKPEFEESEEYLSYLRQRFGYAGKANVNAVLSFLSSIMARRVFPNRNLILYSFKHPDWV